MVVMKIKLYKDSAGALHAEFLDGLNSVSQNNSNVNGVLVVLDNFDLMPEEVLRIAYELESGAEVDDYTLMEDNGDGTYSAEVPPAVTRSDVGTEWFLGLQIASNWVENDDYTGYLYKQNLVERLKFTVNNAVRDLNGKYPSRGDLTALYQEAQAKIEKEEKNAANMPLVPNRPIYVSKSYTEIRADIEKDDIDVWTSSDDCYAFWYTDFNRTAVVGDKFGCTCSSSDGYIFEIAAEVVKVVPNNRVYFKILDKGLNETDDFVLLYNPNEVSRVAEKLQSEMPLVAKSVLYSSDFFSSNGEEMYVSIGKFNRTPIIDEDFVVIVQGGDKSSYIVHYRVLELDGAHAVCKLIGSEQLGVDEERLSFVEAIAQQNTSDIEGIRQDIINESHFRGYLLTNADVQALAGNANDYAYSAESGTKWIFHPAPSRWIDSGVPVPDQVVPASDVTPLMDGEPSAGQEGAYSRADHRHPSDTSKVNKAGDEMTGPLTIGEKWAEESSGFKEYLKLQKDGIEIGHTGEEEYAGVTREKIYTKDVAITGEGVTLSMDATVQGDTDRILHFPAPRIHPAEESDPYTYYYDETLAALSDIEPIEDKLDTVEEIAKGAQIAESFTSYEAMVNTLVGELLGGSDGLTELKYRKGQSIYIETVDVPDLWISRIEEDNHNAYLYTTDEAIISALATNGYIQVGHYRLAQLENGKVVMTDYVRKTELTDCLPKAEGLVWWNGTSFDPWVMPSFMLPGDSNHVQATSLLTCALGVSYSNNTYVTEIYADKVRVAWADGLVRAYYQHDGITYGNGALSEPIDYKLLYPTDVSGNQTIETRERAEGLPKKAGWKITKHKLNHGFSFLGDGVTHAGVASFIEYERMDDSTKHMITADIQITSGEDITNPEDFKVSLVTLGTKWKSAGMLVSGVFPDGFKDATKYTHMTVDKYSWIMDQTEGSVGLLDGVGTVIPQVYAVRDASGYNAALWGIAVELTKTNSGKSLHIDGKHICLTFYDFHTVTDA